MNYCELTASVTALANALARKLSADEISILAALLVQLGDTLATIALKKHYVKIQNKKADTICVGWRA